MKKFKKVSDEKNIARIQENIGQAIDIIVDKAIIDGILIKDISLVTGSVNIISHKLNRKPLGYIVVKRDAESTIWDTSSNTKVISLNCSANVTVSIWIF